MTGLVTVVIQVALAVFLFFAINWIGEHSVTFGYLQLSLTAERDTAPAFNFVLKALAPSAYIIIAATMLYLLHGAHLVQSIWLVAAYYFAFRLLYNILMSRTLLLNWPAITLQSTVGIGAAYWAYTRLILPRRPLFPDVESVGNQLWVIIALFLYAALNNVRTSDVGTIRRKNHYLRKRYAALKKSYAELIDGQFPTRSMELVAYAVLIYETFNRPWLTQVIERAVFPWGSHTLGPMQVHTDVRLSDRAAVAAGLAHLRECYGMTYAELKGKSVYLYDLLSKTVAKYNRDSKYVGEVMNLLYTLWAQVATEYRTDFETWFSSQVLS